MNRHLPMHPEQKAVGTVAPLAPRPAPQATDTPREAYFRLARRPLFVGVVAALLLFGVFGVWAATAPLVGGAIASGTVSPDSSRRVIQHLEGGIVRAVHVREGQKVHQGDPLVTLDSILRRRHLFGAARAMAEAADHGGPARRALARAR